MNILRLLVLLILSVASASSQVLIAPMAVYLGDRTVSSTVQIMNPSSDDKEVQLRLEFGYPKSDELGTTTVEYADSLAASRHSCATWVSVFPKRFILKAGQRQTVRLTGRIPTELGEGVYWARLITTTAASMAGNVADTTSKVGTQINFNYNQVIPVTFRHGNPRLSLSTSGLKTVDVAGRSSLLLPLAVDGFGAFVGTVDCDAQPINGGSATQVTVPISVYFNATKRIGEPLSALTAGEYRLRLRVGSTVEGASPDTIAEVEPMELESMIRVGSDGNIAIVK